MVTHCESVGDWNGERKSDCIAIIQRAAVCKDGVSVSTVTDNLIYFVLLRDRSSHSYHFVGPTVFVYLLFMNLIPDFFTKQSVSVRLSLVLLLRYLFTAPMRTVQTLSRFVDIGDTFRLEWLSRCLGTRSRTENLRCNVVINASNTYHHERFS